MSETKICSKGHDQQSLRNAVVEIWFGELLGPSYPSNLQVLNPPASCDFLFVIFIGKTGKNLNLFIAGSNQRWKPGLGMGLAGCSLSGGGGGGAETWIFLRVVDAIFNEFLACQQGNVDREWKITDFLSWVSMKLDTLYNPILFHI